jgi:hypothetical protein
MSFPASAYALEQPIEYNGSDYQAGLSEFVLEVLRHVDLEMRRKPAHMVYEMLQIQLARRLPGVAVDDEVLRDAAAPIAVGLPVD